MHICLRRNSRQYPKKKREASVPSCKYKRAKFNISLVKSKRALLCFVIFRNRRTALLFYYHQSQNKQSKQTFFLFYHHLNQNNQTLALSFVNSEWTHADDGVLQIKKDIWLFLSSLRLEQAHDDSRNWQMEMHSFYFVISEKNTCWFYHDMNWNEHILIVFFV